MSEDEQRGSDECSATSSTRRIAGPQVANACYFRSTAATGRRKALLKITDRCDLRCAHCFVSATAAGDDMRVDSLARAIPRLVAARVANVTITGGEPLVHPKLTEILSLLREECLEVTVCTNAVALTDELIERALGLGCIRFNVSLDGVTADSHGRFRGDRGSFDATIRNTRRLADAGLLKGVLSTPNSLADPSEYEQLYELVDELGGEYLLMNPLSSFGRGILTRSRFEADTNTMMTIKAGVSRHLGPEKPEAVFIRFPNPSLALREHRIII